MRVIPHVLSLLGAIVLLVAFGRYCTAAMPYQDATPEMLATQRGQIESSRRLAAAGGVVVGVGVFWANARRRVRSLPDKR